MMQILVFSLCFVVLFFSKYTKLSVAGQQRVKCISCLNGWIQISLWKEKKMLHCSIAFLSLEDALTMQVVSKNLSIKDCQAWTEPGRSWKEKRGGFSDYRKYRLIFFCLSRDNSVVIQSKRPLEIAGSQKRVHHTVKCGD